MKKIIAMLLCVSVLFSATAFLSPSDKVHAQTQAELEAEIRQIESEIAANKAKLSSLKDKKESQQEYLDTLKTQIASTEKKASVLELQVQTLDNEIVSADNQLKQLGNEISLLEEEVKIAGEQIEQRKKDIQSSEDNLSSKLRASYVSGKQSFLKILMGAKNLASFLTRLEMMKRMSENDKKVIDEFKGQVESLKQTQNEMVTKQAELSEKHREVETTKATAIQKKAEYTKLKADYQATVKQLESNYAAVEKYIEELDKSSSVYENYISNLEKERQEADLEIERLIASYQATTVPTTVPSTLYASNGDPSTTASSSQGSGNSGDMVYQSNDSWVWPLGTISCYVSSGYGYRDASIGGNSFHGGLDISASGVYGKPIYASRAGTVIAAVIGETGYGRYVVIDHGDGFTTVYGHCSELCVSQGQYVEKGALIARVGSTGNSTGPHLHFEVRYNGQKQNPLNYVKKP